MRSRPFAWSGRGRVRRRYSRRQLRPSTSRRTSRPAPFQRRGCGQPLVLLGPRAAFTGPCRSLTLSLSLPGTPESVSETARCARRCRPSFTSVGPCVDLRAEGPHVTPPVRARWARPESAFRRLENPRAETHGPDEHQLLIVCAQPRTDSPSLHSCLASVRLRASFWLAPCRVSSPRDLAISRWARRATRPIDFCHPDETACTRTSYVPGYLPRLSPRGRLPEFGLRTA